MKYFFLFFISISLLFSCNKNTNIVKEQNIKQDIINTDEDTNIDIESNDINIAKELVFLISDNSLDKKQYNVKQDNKKPVINNVSSLESIIMAQGYYIQQSGRSYNHGNCPEILTLIVEDENVSIREIDIVDNKLIIRNEILLNYNEKTYVHNKTRLELLDDELQIIYGEYKPEKYGAEIWNFDKPYTYAGNLNLPIQENVKKLTTDYLITFTGEYVFDSYAIFEQENNKNKYDFENSKIEVFLNKEKKCLSIRNDFNNFNNPFTYKIQQYDFIETNDNEPFYWLFGEASGYIEIKVFFYKGGIAFYYNKALGYYIDEDVGYKSDLQKYIIFLEK